MLPMYSVLVYIYFHVFPVRVAIFLARKKETGKEAWKVKSSIFQVELFAKMDGQKKIAYGHVCLVRTAVLQPKHNDYIILLRVFVGRYESVIA